MPATTAFPSSPTSLNRWIFFETQTDGSNQLKLRERAKSSDKAADSAPAAKTSATKAGTTAKPAPRTAAKKTDAPAQAFFQQADTRRPKRR